MTGDRQLAARAVTGMVAGMVAVTAAATVVGFWLSYNGLHTFAVRSGALTGPEAWAWPASVDLFIAAGEAGVTISALRRRRDPMAWAYLALGFAASVTGNILHVDTGHLAWARYAVAAVPPMAAMLALAAVLRHVYRLAVDRHTARTAPPAGHPGPAGRGGKRATGRATQRATAVPPRAVEAYRASVAAGAPLPGRALARQFRISRRQAANVRAAVAAEADGHGGEPGQLTTT